MPRRSASGSPTTTRPARSRARSGPLPTTSANLSGEPDLPDAQAIADTLGDAIALVIDGGPIQGGPASTVVDCTRERPRVLREGAIPAWLLAETLERAGHRHAIRGDRGPLLR